jgi:hypothetical protein
MNLVIQFTVIGADAGPFDIYSDVNGYSAAFASGITTAQLLIGYSTTQAPDGTTVVKLKSLGACKTETLVNVTGIPTTTTSTTVNPPSTTTSSSTTVGPTQHYHHEIITYTCLNNGCNSVGFGVFINKFQLTVNRYYLNPQDGQVMLITSVIPTMSLSGGLVATSSGKLNCSQVDCNALP